MKQLWTQRKYGKTQENIVTLSAQIGKVCAEENQCERHVVSSVKIIRLIYI